MSKEDPNIAYQKSKMIGKGYTHNDINNPNKRATFSSQGQPPKQYTNKDGIKNKPSGSGCFPKGTLINTPSGLQDISTLQKGDLVLSVSQDRGESQFRKVVKKLSHKNRRIWILKFTGEKLIRTTSVHSFSVDGSWKTAHDLKPGDSVDFFESDGSIIQRVVTDSHQTAEGENVYNLVVEGDFNFVADGAVAHSFTYFRKLRVFTWTLYGNLVSTLPLFENVLSLIRKPVV